MGHILKDTPTPTTEVDDGIRTNKNGYLYNILNNRLIHRMVYYRAFPRTPGHHHIHHINGRKLDNDLSNLIDLHPHVHGELHSAWPMNALPNRQEIVAWLKYRSTLRNKKERKKWARRNMRRLRKGRWNNRSLFTASRASLASPKRKDSERKKKPFVPRIILRKKT